jgi:hypothetical protein
MELLMKYLISAESRLMYSGGDSGGRKFPVPMTAPRVQTCIYGVPSLTSCR